MTPEREPVPRRWRTTRSRRDSQFGSGNIGAATFFASAEFDDFIVTSVGPGPTPTPTTTPTPTPIPTPTPTSTPTPTPTPTPQPVGDQPIGFASLNGGVTGGLGGSAAFEASQYYQHNLDPASSVPDLVMSHAGAGKLP